MTISKKLQDAMSGQIKHEIYSAYLYLAMSAYCDAEGFPGCAHWLRTQWQEEIEHATRIMRYVNSRGGRITLAAIDKPPSKFGTTLELFEQVLEHEQTITSKIYKLYDQATSEKDHATAAHLQWFITEQVEEEDIASGLVESLKMIGDHTPALMMFDRRLSEREA
jgi:ferritin